MGSDGGAVPTDGELREFVAAMLSNLDKQLREPEVIEAAIESNRDMWISIYRASLRLDGSNSS